MQQAAAFPVPAPLASAGTGGFIHPETIVNNFDVREGMKIADFGCGAGYFTIILAEKIGPQGRIYALDIQESALDNVRAKARTKNLENIETIRTNLEVVGSSSLIDQSQDLVLFANILFQSNKDANIIKEGVRVLKTGGELIIIDWKKGADGFGPPDDLRQDLEDTKQLAVKNGLKLSREFDAGRFHFGLIFKK